MTAPNWVPTFMLRGFWDEMSRRGVSFGELERLSGVPPARSGDIFSVALEQDVFRLFEAAMTLTGDPVLGLSVGRATGPFSFHLLGLLALASPTLQHALELGKRALPHLDYPLPKLEPLADGRARFGLPGDPRVDCEGARFKAEMAAVLLHDLAVHFMDRRDACPTVMFGFRAPADVSPYRRIFAGPVEFNGDGTFAIFRETALLRRRSGVDPSLTQQLVRLAQEQTVGAIGGTNVWTNRVRGALRAHRAPRLLEADQLASQLRVSRRVLSRRLAREGANLSHLIDAELFDRAKLLLHRPSSTASHVAAELGYAELSSFFRAFRRWSGGQTPNEYRRHLLEKSAPQ